MPTNQAVVDWVNHGSRGPLLGRIPLNNHGWDGVRDAYIEVYWIGTNDFVGGRYPDNARMALPIASRHWEKGISEKIRMLQAGKRLLRIRKGKLRIRSKPKLKIAGVAPKLKLRIKGMKPKLKRKQKPRFRR